MKNMYFFPFIGKKANLLLLFIYKKFWKTSEGKTILTRWKHFEIISIKKKKKWNLDFFPKSVNKLIM